MAPVARRQHLNPIVALHLRHGKHGVGNEGIVLCRNDEGGDGDGTDDMACPYTIVVVGSAGEPSVRGRIAVVELTHPGGTIEILEIPLAGEERSLSFQSCFEFQEEMSVVNPVARLFQSLDTFGGSIFGQTAIAPANAASDEPASPAAFRIRFPPIE